MTSNFDPTVVNPVSASAQASYAQILATNPTNVGVQQLAQLVPASSFKVMGAQLFAGVNGQSREVYHADWKQFQPRVGFAYRLGANTVVRGGFGRFVQPTYDAGGQNGFSTTTPLTATTNNYLTPYDSLANPFQNGIQNPTGASLGPLTNLGQAVNWLNQDPGRPYSWEYSLHLQRQVKSWLFEAGYTHNQTSHLPQGLNQNLPAFELHQQLLAPQFTATGAPVATLAWNQLVPNPFFGLAGVSGSIATSKTIAMNQLLNPVTILGGITENNNPIAKNQYDALLTKVERRFSKGVHLVAAVPGEFVHRAPAVGRDQSRVGQRGPAVPSLGGAGVGDPGGAGEAGRSQHAEGATGDRWRLGTLGCPDPSVRIACAVQYGFVLQR